MSATRTNHFKCQTYLNLNHQQQSFLIKPVATVKEKSKKEKINFTDIEVKSQVP